MYKYVFNLLFTLYIVIKLGLKTLWTTLKIHACTDILVTIPSIIIAIAALPISLILLSVLWVYRQIVHMILMLILRDNYGGLITGCNAIASIGEGKEPGVITLVFYLNSDKSEKEIFTIIKDRLKDIMKSTIYAKLFTIRKKYMGFIYLEMRNFHVEEIIGSIADEDLRDFMNKHCHREMPRLNTGNFDLYVGRRRILNCGYPIVIRMHHCLTDGLSLYNLVSRMFGIQTISKDTYANNLSDGIKKNITKEDIWRTINRLRCAEITSLFPVSCHNDIFSEKNGNTSDTILTYALEQDEKYVPTVKRIKKRFPNMHFNTIILTAVSASLAEFYMEKREFNEIPESIHTSLFVQMDHGRFKNAYGSGDHIELGNDFSLLYPQIIVVPKGRREETIANYIVDRLFIMHKEFNRIVESPEYITNYTMLTTLVSLVPSDLMKPLFALGKMTVACSSMPGGPAIDFFTGDPIQNVIFFTPKSDIMGLCLTVLTYGNKLQLGLKACKSKCNNVNELDAILQGVFRYIDILDEKTASYNCTNPTT